jgi:hypothetical protein
LDKLGALGVSVFAEITAGIILASLAIYYGRFIPKIFPLLKIGLASSIMGVCLFALQPLSIILSIVLGTVVYGFLIILFRILPTKSLLTLFQKIQN